MWLPKIVQRINSNDLKTGVVIFSPLSLRKTISLSIVLVLASISLVVSASFTAVFDLVWYQCCYWGNLGWLEWKWPCCRSSCCSICLLLSISCQVFDLVLARIESTESFSLRCKNYVFKSAIVINSSSIVSGSVLWMVSGGNSSIGSIRRLVVPGSVADLITDWQTILPASSSTSFQHIFAPIFLSTPAYRVLFSFDLTPNDWSSRSRRLG